MLKFAREFADPTWEASAFLEAGSVGYSATRRPERFAGLKLRTSAWRIEPAVVEYAHPSFFEDLTRFPAGSALLMRRAAVVWEPLITLHSEAGPAA